MSAALAAARDEDLNPGLLGLLGHRNVIDLGGGRDPCIADALWPSFGCSEADGDQVRTGVDRAREQLGVAVERPGEQSDAVAHAGCSGDAGFALEQLNGSGAPDPDHPEATGRGHRDGKPSSGGAAHRRVENRHLEPERC